MAHWSTGGRSRADLLDPAPARLVTARPGRAVLVVTAVVLSFQDRPSDRPLTTALVLTGLLVLSVLAVAGRLPRLDARSALLERVGAAVVRLSVSLCVLRAATYEAGLDLPGPDELRLLLVVLALVAVWATPRAVTTAAFATLLVSQCVVLGLVVHGTPFVDDVPLYVAGAVRDLLHLHAPYGGSIPNPFDAEGTARWLAPEVVSGDRILVGFPYLPGALLTAVPGHLLGDYRLTYVVVMPLLSLVWWRLATDPLGRSLAVLGVMSPFTAKLVGGGWVEPPIMLALAVTALAVARGWRARGALGVAWLLASKQYFVFVLPFLLPVARRLGWRVVLGGVAGAGLLGLLFLAWAPHDFVHDVATFQLLQPYRPDSTSLVVALGERYGRPPEWVLTLLPLVGGLGVSAYLGLRARPGATTTAAVVALGLLTVVMLSKEGFFNYFTLVAAGLLTAAVAWPADGPDAPPTRHSLAPVGNTGE